jgi:hypothetical protein
VVVHAPHLQRDADAGGALIDDILIREFLLP